MKLYFAPGACSLSPHIVLREAGIDVELEQVDLKSKKTKSGADYTAVNPKGQVPALALDNGQTLTEGPAIVQYLADQKPDSRLAPRNGTFERYRLQEWLNLSLRSCTRALALSSNPRFRTITSVSRRRRFPTASPLSIGISVKQAHFFWVAISRSPTLICS